MSSIRSPCLRRTPVSRSANSAHSTPMPEPNSNSSSWPPFGEHATCINKVLILNALDCCHAALGFLRRNLDRYVPGRFVQQWALHQDRCPRRIGSHRRARPLASKSNTIGKPTFERTMPINGQANLAQSELSLSSQTASFALNAEVRLLKS